MPSPEASRRNLQKARASWRPPERSEGIKHFVWRWHISTAQKESGRALARRLGVSHTYVHKLVRKFLKEPPWPPFRVREVEIPFVDATQEELKHAQSVSPTHKPESEHESELDASEKRVRRFIEERSRRSFVRGRRVWHPQP